MGFGEDMQYNFLLFAECRSTCYSTIPHSLKERPFSSTESIPKMKAKETTDGNGRFDESCTKAT